MKNLIFPLSLRHKYANSSQIIRGQSCSNKRPRKYELLSPRHAQPVRRREPVEVVLHPSCEGAVEVVGVEEGAEGHRVQVHGLHEVGQEGALDAKDVPPGELVCEEKISTLI